MLFFPYYYYYCYVIAPAFLFKSKQRDKLIVRTFCGKKKKVKRRRRRRSRRIYSSYKCSFMYFFVCVEFLSGYFFTKKSYNKVEKWPEIVDGRRSISRTLFVGVVKDFMMMYISQFIRFRVLSSNINTHIT